MSRILFMLLVIMVSASVRRAEMRRLQPHADAQFSSYERRYLPPRHLRGAAQLGLYGQKEGVAKEKIAGADVADKSRDKRSDRCSNPTKYESWFGRGCPPGWECWHTICVMRRRPRH